MKKYLAIALAALMALSVVACGSKAAESAPAATTAAAAPVETQAVATQAAALAEKTEIKAHEFHYYDSSNNGNNATATKPNSAGCWECAHIDDNHWWGYAHLYYESNHEFPISFVKKCAEYRQRRYGGK